MSLYGTACKIGGVACGMVLRSGVNGYYRAVFEREFASLEDIEGIQWDQPVIEGDCILPDGYGFTVEDIEYSAATRSYTVVLKVGQQYLGDVTGYQAQVEELNQKVAQKDEAINERDAAISEKDAQLAEKDRVIQEREQAAQAREEELEAAYQEGVESNG